MDVGLQIYKTRSSISLQWPTASASPGSSLARLSINLLNKLAKPPETQGLTGLSIFSDMQQWLEENHNNNPATSTTDNNGPNAVSLLTGEELWNCSLCRKMFVSKYYFQRHMKCHFTKQELCPYCPFRSTYKWNLKSHIRNKHKDKMPSNHLVT